MKSAMAHFCFFCLLLLISCDSSSQGPPHGAPLESRSATAETTRINAAVKQHLPLEDGQDFTACRRGLIASDPNLQVADKKGKLIWDQPAYLSWKERLRTASTQPLAPGPQLNNIHGLFKVTDGIYQLRGFCLSNMTLIEGERGWIVVDPLTTRETASRAIAFAWQHLPARPVTAVIFTHSHIDHFGGIFGVLSAEDASKNNVRIIAPLGFMEEATSENILAGIAMGRRAEYMYGRHLAPSPLGHVDNGLGKATPFGTFGILAPTELVSRTPQEMVIDGVRFIFQHAPDSEAPAELAFYLPDKRAYCGAEIVSRTQHNLYTLRGAKIRDALSWSNSIDDAIRLFADAEIYFGCHHWPVWGQSRVRDFLKKQRDTYKYIHDQTLRLANTGLTPIEIAEEIRLPETLRTTFASRGYYGTLRHNARAVYQAYFGWYDANPPTSIPCRRPRAPCAMSP
jgi:alkyl sulfatase BDS1-like metallo-beta-lactamase superfamily hydrolase